MSIEQAVAPAGQEHWTKKGDLKLFLWEKRATAQPLRGTILFVHGSSMASTPTFDLQMPSRPFSSAMDFFAAQGYDLRALLRAEASEADLASAVAHIWQGRTDRYSELRSALAPDAGSGMRRVEMSYIGG